MTIASETTLVSPLTSTPTTFGTITPSFERLMGFVDVTGNNPGQRILWQLFATSGGVRALAAQQVGITPNLGVGGLQTYTIFEDPDTSQGQRGFGVVGASTYEIVGTALDGNMTNVKGGFVGYDIEANTQPNEVVAASHPLVFNTEVAFGSLTAHHGRIQVQFDNAGVLNADATAKVYGTITGAAGPITALIATASISGAQANPSIPINLVGLGFRTASLHILATNPNVGAAAVTAVIVGVDLNLDIGGGTPGAVTAGSADIIFRPGAPSPPVGNVAGTWADVEVLAARCPPDGSIYVEVDSSGGTVAANVTGTGSAATDSRMIFSPGSADGFDILSIPDGAQLGGFAGIMGNLQINGSPGVSGLNSIEFRAAPFSVKAVLIIQGSLVNSGTIPLVSYLAAVTTAAIFGFNTSFTANGAGAEVVKLAAGVRLIVDFLDNSFVTPTNEFAGASSAAGSHLEFQRDNTSGAILKGAYTGTFDQLSLFQGPTQNNIVILAPAGANTYTIDSAAIPGPPPNFDHDIYCTVPAVGAFAIVLPSAAAPYNKGRELVVIDRTGGSGPNPIVLTPQAADSINHGASGATKNLTNTAPGTQWIIRCDGVGWYVAQMIGV